MAVLLKCDALFLHIPKTGGSWVRHVLREEDLVRMEWPDPHPDLDRVLNLPRYYPLHFAKQSIKLRSLDLYRSEGLINLVSCGTLTPGMSRTGGS
jgi:hypothetical protein